MMSDNKSTRFRDPIERGMKIGLIGGIAGLVFSICTEPCIDFSDFIYNSASFTSGMTGFAAITGYLSAEFQNYIITGKYDKEKREERYRVLDEWLQNL